MSGHRRELGYGMTIVLGTALALVATMLGLFVDPLLATVVGSGLVVGGTVAFVPREQWVVAGTIGVGAVVLAGTLVPRLIVELRPFRSVMPVTLGLEIVIVVAAVATVHYLTFQPRTA